jgi:pimeloyl-ACP methyl ester carboxylesterase
MTPDELYASLTNDQSVWEGRVPTGPDAAFAAARELEARSVGRFVHGPFDPSLPDKLRRLDVPTLILWGDDDRIVPAGHAPAWQAALPGARLQRYPGVGHLLFHERREPLDEILAFADQ